MSRHRAGDPVTCKIRLLSRPCSSCVMFPDDRVHLGQERRRAFIQETLDKDSYVICHETLRTATPTAACRGFFNKHRRDTLALRLMVRFGLYTEVEPPS